MENKNPIFSIKNFRSFGEQGADFELAPITVLTGCNSAGKSSLVKALLLLSRYLTSAFPDKMDIDSCYDLDDSYFGVLQISSKDLTLGNYDKLINDGSNGKIEISYTIFSQYLQEYVRVKRTFQKRDEKNISKDILNGGVCESYLVERLDNTPILKTSGFSDNFWSRGNLSAIEENFIRFENTCKAEKDFDYIQTASEEGIAKEKLEELFEQIKSFERNNPTIKGLHSLESMNMISDWNDLWSNKDRVNKIKEHVFVNNPKDCGENFIKRDVFANLVNNEVIAPFFLRDINYIDSSSAIIKRIYSIEDNDKICLALRKLYNRIEENRYGDTYLNKPYHFINKWIKRFGIGERISIEGTEEGLGLLMYLIKDEKKRLLADEGYGVTQLVSLLLNIENQIPDEAYMGRSECPESFICVEEPENHLHPKFQSMLAEMFVEAYQKYNIHFVIETHSEYLIRKLQVMVADNATKLKASNVSLNYVDKDERGVATNRKIEILEDGRLSEPFGPGFFDEADTLAMNLMKYKARRK